MSILRIFAESLSEYSQSGNVTLYHYSREDSEQLILDPEMFGKHSFTRREAKISTYPRVFFYLDPTDKERFFQSNTWNLYTAEVKADEIYDLDKDPQQYIQQNKDNNNGIVDWEQLFKTADNKYNGMHYSVKNRDIVVWFNSISVNKQA